MDHFDNRTTAMLVLLYGVEHGNLPVFLKAPQTCHKTVLNFDTIDLLPTLEAATWVQNGQLWHIQDILFDTFPDLCKWLAKSIPPLSTVKQIPIHKTEQFPLPTMHLDKSSLDGTLQVLSKILKDLLKLTEDDVKKHGIIICAGDQLTLSLLDKVS